LKALMKPRLLPRQLGNKLDKEAIKIGLWKSDLFKILGPTRPDSFSQLGSLKKNLYSEGRASGFEVAKFLGFGASTRASTHHVTDHRALILDNTMSCRSPFSWLICLGRYDH
jgi:hypothetical protein